MEVGLDQALADEIASTAAEVAIAAMEAEVPSTGTERVVAAARMASDATASELEVPTFLGKVGTGVVTVVQAVEEQLPAELPAEDVISAAVEAIAEAGGDENLAALLAEGEDITTIGERLAAEVINAAAALGLFSETEMPDAIAKFSDATMSGVASGGAFADAAAVQDSLDRLSRAAAETIGTLYASSSSGTLASALEKLGQGMVQGLQRHPELSQHVGLDDAFESITAGGVAGLSTAGISSATIGSMSAQLVQGLTIGALNGLNLPAGGAPAFSVTQINSALSSCGTFLSNALTAAGQTLGTDLSALSGSGTGLVSSISTVISSFSSVSGVTAPSSCTITVAAPSSTGTGGGGGTGATCTASSTPFIGTGTHQSVGMGMNLNGSSIVRLAQGFTSPSSATSLASIKIYGRVTSGTPTVSVYVIPAADIGTLPSAIAKGSFSSTDPNNSWVTVNLTQSVPLTASTQYVIGFAVAGGAFELRRGFPTSGVAADSLIHPGTVYQDGGSGMNPVNETRGDDLDMALFACQ